MSGRRDERSGLAALPAWVFEAAAAIVVIIATPVYILVAGLAVVRLVGLLGHVGITGSIAVFIAVSVPALVPIATVALVDRWRSRACPRQWPGSGLLARLDPAQPSDLEIMAAAEATLEHSGDDVWLAICWMRREAIHCLQRGDLRRHLVALRIKRALEGLAQR